VKLSPRIRLIRVAKLQRRQAELLAELAELQRLIADEYGVIAEVDASPSTGRKRQAPHAPELPEITELDRERARRELRRNEIGRRVGR